MDNEKIYRMKFSKVYPLLVQKAERKNRTKEEVDEIITWLTGYSKEDIDKQLEKDLDYEEFFEKAPNLNSNANKITGVVCGIRVEDIEDSLVLKVRWLDKLIDELAKGKKMEKILRS